MEKNYLYRKGIVFIVIVFFICASFGSNIGGYSEEINQIDADVADVYESQENVVVTCYTFGFSGEPSQEITMPISEAEFLYDKIKELQIEIARDPLSDKTKQLQNEIIALADEHNLLPAGLSAETLKSCLIQSSRPQHPRIKLPRLQNRASEMFCNYVSIGSGTSFPIIILPRLIPILLTPIPRLFVRWSTMDGVTSCGGLRSGTGFIATGAQNGIALGFWGIGFSIFLPPFMAYGLLGYALFASVNAQEIELWPPNRLPVISDVNPSNKAENIPISLSELSFRIQDGDGELMDYIVETSPDIGSANVQNKGDELYTVPVSGLEGSTEYTWSVKVTDGEDWTNESYTFTTVPVAPFVSDPVPPDGSDIVLVSLSQLSFTLTDYQGDPMDYTVETSPDIGSDSATGVGDGTYTVDVIGLDYSTEYTWYVNVTDGTYWKHETFTFTTLPEGVIIFHPTDDTYVMQDYPTSIRGHLDNIYIQNHYGAGGSSNWGCDMLIKFDLSSISPGTLINSATLKIYYYKWTFNSPAGNDLTLHRVTSDWDEVTACWNNRPSYTPEVTSSAIVPGSPGFWMEWDVTSDVQDFIDGQEINYGFQIIDDEYWGATNIPVSHFRSKEYGSLIPYLETIIVE